jgi:hypothetical protein
MRATATGGVPSMQARATTWSGGRRRRGSVTPRGVATGWPHLRLRRVDGGVVLEGDGVVVCCVVVSRP